MESSRQFISQRSFRFYQMGQWELLILLYGPMGASHLVKTKRTLTDELPTGRIMPLMWSAALQSDMFLPPTHQTACSTPNSIAMPWPINHPSCLWGWAEGLTEAPFQRGHRWWEVLNLKECLLDIILCIGSILTWMKMFPSLKRARIESVTYIKGIWKISS